MSCSDKLDGTTASHSSKNRTSFDYSSYILDFSGFVSTEYCHRSRGLCHDRISRQQGMPPCGRITPHRSSLRNPRSSLRMATWGTGSFRENGPRCLPPSALSTLPTRMTLVGFPSRDQSFEPISTATTELSSFVRLHGPISAAHKNAARSKRNVRHGEARLDNRRIMM